jgi:hypothetical protein
VAATAGSVGTLRARAELLTLLLHLAGSGDDTGSSGGGGGGGAPSVLMGSVDGLALRPAASTANGSRDSAAWRSGGWVTLRARWVTLRARWVTLSAGWVNV